MLASALLALSVAGCTGFGPQTMREQQADYAAAVADGGKRQTLLNIVRLRYGDVPAFLSVDQILAGYSLQGTFSGGTDILSGGSPNLSDDANVGVGGTFTNNPTVTYAPVTGANFARTFLAPLQPADLFGLMLAGSSPELVLGLGLSANRGRSAVRRGAGSVDRAVQVRPAVRPIGGPGPKPDRHFGDRLQRQERRAGATATQLAGSAGLSDKLRAGLCTGHRE